MKADEEEEEAEDEVRGLEEGKWGLKTDDCEREGLLYYGCDCDY